MIKIKTEKWGVFTLGKIFEHISQGNRLRKLDQIPGACPFVMSGTTNAGIVAFIGNPVNNFPANSLTIDIFGNVFYRDYEFSASDDVGVYWSDKQISKSAMLFICAVIRKKLGERPFSDKLRSSQSLGIEIRLPVTQDDQPDFDYMDGYMSEIIKSAKMQVHALSQADKGGHKVNISGWQKFHLYDDGLFTIDMGTKLDKVKMTEINPSVNFIGRANANNGITTSVDTISGIKPYDAGNMTLSLGGEYLGSCFVQPKPFYTSQNVVVLMPLWDMPFEVKMFIATMVFKESQTYYKAFVNELNRHIKKGFSFWLPVTSSRTPDWQHMEGFMRKKINDASTFISSTYKL